MLKRLLAYLIIHRPHKKSGDLSALEARQTPDGSPHFNDSFYFCGRDATGTSLVFRLGFRPGRRTETWCDMILPGLGRFRAPLKDEPDSGRIGCGALDFRCREPGRTWTVSYSGPLEDGRRSVKAELDLAFAADTPIIDFSAAGDSWGLAGHIAGQKWSREWFGRLRDLSQVHYEQAGTLSGRIRINGQDRQVALSSVRDHSFGARDWRSMKRHVWIMALMEDGSRINVSLVGYDFLPYMHSGFRISEGRITPVTRAPRFEEVPPSITKGSAFTIVFKAGRNQPIDLRCSVEDMLKYTMADGYRFSEGLAAFSLGSLKGVGVCEYGTA